MNTAYANNIGAHFAGLHGGIDPNTVTAGSGADNVAQNGGTIDRTALKMLHNSVKLQVPVKAVLAAGATFTGTLKIQDSADGTTWADYTYRATGATGGSATKVLTGQSGGSTEHGIVELDVDLSGARVKIRGVFTPDLSASGTDTALIGPLIFNFGGGPDQPAAV